MDELLQQLRAAAESWHAHSQVMDADGHEATAEEVEKNTHLQHEYESLRAKVEEAKRREDSETARQARRAAAGGAVDAAREFDRTFIRNRNYDPTRSGTSGKLIGRAPEYGNDLQTALATWVRSSSSRTARGITDDDREACARLAINPHGAEFEAPEGMEADYEGYLRHLCASRGNMLYLDQGYGNGMQPGAITGYPYLDSRVPEGAGFTNQPPSVFGRLETNVITYGGIFSAPITVRVVGGFEPIVQDFTDDQYEGYQIGEGHPIGEGRNPKFGQVRWDAYDYTSGSVIATERQLDVSRYNLPDFFQDMLGERIGRTLARKLTWGTGSAEPMGLATAAMKGGKIMETAAAGVVDEDDIAALEYSLDEYHASGPGVGWMMNRSTLLTLEKLKDLSGRPLFNLGLETTTNRRVLRNRPIYINYQMPSIATAKVPILFGDFSRYVVIRRRSGIPRLIRDSVTLASELKVAFTAIITLDGKLRDYGNSPVAGLKIKA